jgi:hypothetical protein
MLPHLRRSIPLLTPKCITPGFIASSKTGIPDEALWSFARALGIEAPHLVATKFMHSTALARCSGASEDSAYAEYDERVLAAQPDFGGMQ